MKLTQNIEAAFNVELTPPPQLIHSSLLLSILSPELLQPPQSPHPDTTTMRSFAILAIIYAAAVGSASGVNTEWSSQISLIVLSIPNAHFR